MDDTESTFPELPEVPLPQPEQGSEVSQPTHPIASAQDETCGRLAVARRRSPVEGGIVGPLAVLVGFPLLVVAAILLLWWLGGLLH